MQALAPLPASDRCFYFEWVAAGGTRRRLGWCWEASGRGVLRASSGKHGRGAAGTEGHSWVQRAEGMLSPVLCPWVQLGGGSAPPDTAQHRQHPARGSWGAEGHGAGHPAPLTSPLSPCRPGAPGTRRVPSLAWPTKPSSPSPRPNRWKPCRKRSCPWASTG